MDLSGQAALALGGLFLLAVVLRSLRTPLRLLGRVALNAAVGYAALFALHLSAPITGVALGLNVPNALVIAILGAPGLGLLLLLQWMF